MPKRTAVIHGGLRQTWSETYARCRRFACALAKRGIGVGDTVAAMLPNTPPMYEAHFGVPMTGADAANEVVAAIEAGGGAQVSRDADVADQDAGVQVALPGDWCVGELTEQHEVGVAGDDPKAHGSQGFRNPVSLGD